MSGGVVFVVGVRKDDCPGDGSGLNGAGEFFRTVLFVFGQEVDGVTGQRSFQLVAIKLAGQLVFLLAEFHRKVEGSAVKIRCGEPSSGQGGRLRSYKRRNQ